MEGRNWGHQPKCHACENIHSHFGLSCLFTCVFVCVHRRLFLCVLHRGFVRRFRPGSPGAPNLLCAREFGIGQSGWEVLISLQYEWFGRYSTSGSMCQYEWLQCNWCDCWGHFSRAVPAKFVLIQVDMPPHQGPTLLCLRCLELD